VKASPASPDAAGEAVGVTRMPAVFLGHGSPMNAIEDSEFRRGWAELGRRLPRPEAILCVSAHWETRGVWLTSGEAPGTIHDFFGFPPELYAVRYPASGSPWLARRAAELLGDVRAGLDAERGLDHGSWGVLVAMYPEADVPVLQLSLAIGQPPSFHYELARRLAPLRDEGVLVLGSGNLVHNLRLADLGLDRGFDWAVRFDALVRERIETGDTAALVAWESLGPEARLAVPTPEHYLPLLYVLAQRTPRDAVRLINDRCTLGSISMTSVVIG
jgi:4,5-DOPA dioxygenase extradiol